MGNKTKIDWCDATWNPVTGCLHDCEYCYARRIAERFGANQMPIFADYPVLHEPVRCTDTYAYMRDAGISTGIALGIFCFVGMLFDLYYGGNFSLSGYQISAGNYLHIGLLFIAVDMRVSNTAGTDYTDTQLAVAFNLALSVLIACEIVHVKCHFLFLQKMLYSGVSRIYITNWRI